VYVVDSKGPSKNMTYIITTDQSNLSASNLTKETRAVCDGLTAAGHRVVLVDRFDRYWQWRKWKKPIAKNRYEWQAQNKQKKQ
jgi:hypothetical protein